MTFVSYFRWPFILTAIGLSLGFVYGYLASGTLSGGLSIFFICSVLAVLEISLSFDNAIVNANKLKQMTEVWQRRFLTWGILIAVFGMRIVFPLAIVSVAGGIGPVEAVKLAATRPEEYARIMHGAHLGIAAFGGTFLMMVALAFFFDEEKEVHWVRPIEARISRYASIRGMEIAFVLTLMMFFASALDSAARLNFIVAAICGLLVFLFLEVLNNILDRVEAATKHVAHVGLGAFLYLEVLDASFSFDGVIGAFALTQNLFVIAIGLGVGAMYVRSMTIWLVDRGTLNQYRYLEHGAFYAIFVLSLVMYVQSIVHVPEMLTGFAGAAIIGIALWSSVQYNSIQCSTREKVR